MRWADLAVGTYVEGCAEDLYQVDSDWKPQDAIDYEPLLDFKGIVTHITPRKIVWSVCWVWVEDYEETPDDPRFTAGIFGMRRKHIDVLRALDRDGVLRVVDV